jgi:hypothetical protein
MSVLRFVGIPFEEWRQGEQLDDKIMEAGMQLYEAGIQRPSIGQIQEVLDEQGVDVKLRQSENPDEDVVIVQRKQR